MSTSRIMVDMSATLLHHGHIRLIKKAAEHGSVVIGLTTDDEIEAVKGYRPELSYSERAEILQAITEVSEVVPTPWLLTEATLDAHDIDFIVHGDDHSNRIDAGRCILFSRTAGVSSSELRKRAYSAINSKRHRKLMLTPGPAALPPEALLAVRPVFGRGDAEYQDIFDEVSDWLKRLSGQDELVVAQGSSTFALEMAAHAFVSGEVLLIDSGYYARRLERLLPDGCKVTRCGADEVENVSQAFDWILCACTETSNASLLDLPSIRRTADAKGARLFVDATGSIGLEAHHSLADVMGFSSCKGLFGPAGACFVAHKSGLEARTHPSFYLNIHTHRDKMVTGPYHAMCALHGLMNIHSRLLERVRASKSRALREFGEFINNEAAQPLLCTYLNGRVEALDDDVVLYTPRSQLPGSVICHLGEIHSDRVGLTDRIIVKTL